MASPAGTPNFESLLRILHYVNELRLEAGGVVRAVLDLVEGLSQAGLEVTVATGDDTDAPASWRSGGPRVVRIDRRVTRWLAPKGDPSELRRLVADADVVHLHTPWEPFNPVVARAARDAGKPYLLSVHGMLDDWCMAGKAFKKRLYLKLVGRRLLEHAAGVHFTAEAERDQAIKWAPAANPQVLPLLMDTSPYATLVDATAAEAAFPQLAATDEPRLLFLSRVDPKKGVDLLIEAVARLADSATPTQALVAGPGDDAYVAQLQRLAQQRGVADRVHFLGMVRGDAKWSLYRAADVFVLPTHQENFGIVLAEAIGSALPTVTTRQVDIWREIERCGAVITDDTAEATADALRVVLSDLPSAKRQADTGRDRLLEWLDPDRLTGEYRAMYRAAAHAR